MARKKKDESNEDDSGNVGLEHLNNYFKKELNSKEISDVESFISTGSTLLDYAISNRKNGGIPTRRVTELCGNEATGKSLIAYHILANTQKVGGVAIYIDTERAANKEFLTRMGVDWDKLIYTRQSCIEDVFDYIEKVITVTRLKVPDKKVPVVIVWDSVAATPAKSALEITYSEQRMAEEARVMSKCLRKSAEALDEGGVTLVCVNQLRQKIGVMFGDPDITPHGKALPFYASVRVKMSGTKKIVDKDTERTVGVCATAKVFKNKVGPNHREVSFPLMYDFGVNDEQSMLDYLVDVGVVSTGGAWKMISVDGQEKKFQTADWKDLLANKDFRDKVIGLIDDRMIIKFKRDFDTIQVDHESALEIDQLKSDLES
jgi:recombination protein RecA